MKNVWRGGEQGFTLLELMIVVVVVGILGMIAYPSYAEYLRKNNRAEGKAALMNAAQQLERFFTANNQYPGSLAAGNISAYSGQTSAESAYTLSLPTTGTEFVLKASPNAKQSKDGCGTLVINERGVKTVEGATLTAAQCW
jgi:type IV pilus assembly protein PilE